MGSKKDDDLLAEKTTEFVGVQHILTLLFDRNSFKFLCFMIPLTYWTVTTEQYAKGFAIYIGFLLVCDILYYGFSIAIFDPELVISHGYNISTFLNDTLHSAGLDYGFNFYDGDYTKTRHQAQIDKFEYAYKQLNLQEGMSLLDCGCGCGDWLNWLQTEKNLKVVGVNITDQQVKECRARGLNVILSNWKDLDLEKEGLVGQFDAVSFWDTVEHYVNARDRDNEKARNEVYAKVFTMAQRLLKPKSKSGRVWISCLHFNNKKFFGLPFWARMKKTYQVYILDKMHSGCYPCAQRDDLVVNAKKKGLKLVHRKDTTKDYYDTSVLEPSHFGQHVFKWTPLRIVLMLANFFVDPNWIQRALWYYTSDWMAQFDEKDITKSDVFHWWLVLEKEKA